MRRATCTEDFHHQLFNGEVVSEVTCSKLKYNFFFSSNTDKAAAAAVVAVSDREVVHHNNMVLHHLNRNSVQALHHLRNTVHRNKGVKVAERHLRNMVLHSKVAAVSVITCYK